MRTVGQEDARGRLLDQAFAAHTLTEIDAAKQALRDWLLAHPDDLGMADAFEVLSHEEDFEKARVGTIGDPPAEAPSRSAVPVT